MAAGSEVSGPGRGRVRHIARCLGLVALTLVGAAGPASAQSGSGVEVTVDGQPPTFLSAASIQRQAQESHSYQDLGPAGGQTVTRTGVSIRSLLTDAGIDPDRVSLLAVARSRGGFGYLYHADLANPSDFANGPALVSVDGISTRFFRPQRSTGDQNAADDIATPDGQPLAISLYTGRLLKLTATHSPAHTVVGRPVSFTATASCCPLAGETLTYSWTLGDSSQPTIGTSVTHRFAATGIYQATVALTGSQGSVALPVHTTVVVGSPRRSSGRGAGGSDGRKSPTSGPSTGASHGGSGHNGSGAGSSSPTGSPSGSAAPAHTHSTTAPAKTSPATAPEHTAGRSRATPDRTLPPPTPRHSARGSSDRHPRSAASAALLPVHGVLVAGPGTLLASPQSVPSAPQGAQASARAGNPAGSAGELPLGIVAAAGIFAAGALCERRRPRGRPA